MSTTHTLSRALATSIAFATLSGLLASGCVTDGALDTSDLESDDVAVEVADSASIQFVDTPPLLAAPADPVETINAVGTQFDKLRVRRYEDAAGSWIEYENGSAPLHVSACNADGTPCCLGDLSVCFTDNSVTGEDGELELSLAGVAGNSCTVTHQNTKGGSAFQFNRRPAQNCLSGSTCLRLRSPGRTGNPLKKRESVHVVCF